MPSQNHELAYALRRLGRSPSLVLAVVISIGLGIGANATIFSMISRFVLRPAPVGDPSTLLTLHTTERTDRCCNNFSLPLYKDLRDQSKSFSGVAGYFELVPASISGTGDPERIWGQAATSNYFDVAQLRMTHGRGFLPTEDQAPVVILGYRLWQHRFAGDPAILGKSITLSGHPFTVIGITPPAFHGLDLILDPQFWVPFGNVDDLVPNLPDHNSRLFHWVNVAARLKPGVTHDQAAAELATLAKHFAEINAAPEKHLEFRFEQAGSLPPRDRSTVLLFLASLMVVALLVLCIACANVTNLLLAQAYSRQREMAVRIALGATRATLLRQMLLESIILALAGGILGTFLSYAATRGLSAFRFPAPIPLDLTVNVDWRVLLYTFLLSAATGLLFGLIPSWIASRPILTSALKGEDALTRPGRRFSVRNILLVAQISMSLILLCATGLFLRSLQSASGIDIGFRSHNILMMSVDPRVHGYSPERTVQLLTQARQRIAALPGVVSAVATDTVPLSGGTRSDGFIAEGHAKPAGPQPIAELYMATPGYFETMGIPRLAGRDFANESPTGPKVAIINQALAQKLFATQDPIGQRITGGGVTYQIIGVVKDIKSRTLGEDTRPVLFRSLDQTVATDPAFMGYTLLVRTSGDSSSIATAARNQIAALDPTLAIYNTATMEEHLHDALFLPRLAGTLFGVFGFTGLILAAVGLYGVMSYSVTRRTHEIGIRIALGAQLHAIEALLIRQGMRLTLIAVAIGLPAAFALAKFSTSLLYGVRPHDIITFTAVPIFLAVVALLACWIPARRATTVDPQVVLRYE
jgi:predicted permease